MASQGQGGGRRKRATRCRNHASAAQGVESSGREGMLSKVWRMLPRSCGKKRRRYKGTPFSYYGFLEKAARPTNMGFRLRGRLHYSEL